jgi:predicted nucleotidyltransferase
MGKTKTRDAALEDFIQKLRHKYHISELILFGSRAEGRADKESDYDLIVVSADFQGVEFTERIRAMYSLWSSDAGIDILCYTPQEFARKASQIGLVSDATKTGIKLLA